VKILAFQAARFAWRPHARSLTSNDDGGVVSAEIAADAPPQQTTTDAVVAFLHAEPKDQALEARDRVLRHATKHIQWLANKRGLENVVLHSFTHLAADTADAGFAETLLAELGARLARKGYVVSTTPFGFTCAWELAVFGESLAKVWKEI
jgi:Archaea-specific editing domain of threonyl-tRNA synthetase